MVTVCVVEGEEVEEVADQEAVSHQTLGSSGATFFVSWVQ